MQSGEIHSQRLAYNAPLCLDETLAFNPGFEQGKRDERVRNYAKDAESFVLGPMPVQELLDEFLPVSDHNKTEGRSSNIDAFKAIPKTATSTNKTCHPLLSALNGTTEAGGLCPGFTFVNTSAETSSKGGPPNARICCFAKDNVTTAQATPAAEMGYAELFIQVNPDPKADPLADAAGDCKHQSCPGNTFFKCFQKDKKRKKPAQQSLGEHVYSVSELMARQHRTFTFTISVYGSRARILRWDRVGCVASESFDLREDPELLCEFLWRFSQASNAGRGHDTTVMRATAEEEALFKEAITEEVRRQLGLEGDELLKAVSEHYEPGNVAAILVHVPGGDAEPPSVRRFIISRPVVSPSAINGRATRGHWALDVLTSLIVFAKDVWRERTLENEGTVLAGFNAQGVRNVPKLCCHGDVPGLAPGEVQSTVTGDFVEREWVPEKAYWDGVFKKLSHYRVVVDTVGYPLQRFRGTEELLHATYDVFQALRDVLRLDTRVHRDVSLGHIILVKDPESSVRKGCLIGWGVSCRTDITGTAPEDSRRGTWRYMSINTLSRERVRQGHKDDLESLIYVVIYCAMLWIPNNLTLKQLKEKMDAFFEQLEHNERTDEERGGRGKTLNARNRAYTEDICFGNDAVHVLIHTALEYHSPPEEFYEYRDYWDDPDKLDSLWVDTLTTKTLPSDDRSDNLANPAPPPVRNPPEVFRGPDGRPIRAPPPTAEQRAILEGWAASPTPPIRSYDHMPRSPLRPEFSPPGGLSLLDRMMLRVNFGGDRVRYPPYVSRLFSGARSSRQPRFVTVTPPRMHTPEPIVTPPAMEPGSSSEEEDEDDEDEWDFLAAALAPRRDSPPILPELAQRPPKRSAQQADLEESEEELPRPIRRVKLIVREPPAPAPAPAPAPRASRKAKAARATPQAPPSERQLRTRGSDDQACTLKEKETKKPARRKRRGFF